MLLLLLTQLLPPLQLQPPLLLLCYHCCRCCCCSCRCCCFSSSCKSNGDITSIMPYIPIYPSATGVASRQHVYGCLCTSSLSLYTGGITAAAAAAALPPPRQLLSHQHGSGSSGSSIRQAQQPHHSSQSPFPAMCIVMALRILRARTESGVDSERAIYRREMLYSTASAAAAAAAGATKTASDISNALCITSALPAKHADVKYILTPRRLPFID